MSIFEREVLQPIRGALDGNPIQIPFGLDRVNDIFSIRKSIYAVIYGNTGSGKTSLADDCWVLKPYAAWHANRDTVDVTYRGLYRSMERNRSLKLTKWACWRLYKTSGLLLDAETLLGYKKGCRINEDTWDKIVACRDWADEMLDYVDIRDGRTTPDQHNAWVIQHALRQGTLFIADNVGVYNALNHQQYIDKFSEQKVTVLKNGEKELYATYPFDGETRRIKQGERQYYPKKPKEITVIVTDHLGKWASQPNATTTKAKIDLGSSYASDHRDVFGYSPVDIMQLNRSVGDIQRLKHSGNELSPQIDDGKDSNNPAENSDMVLALFNPFRFNAYDDNGMYKGYNIRDRMVNAYGHNRYRLLSILKNSYGIDDVEFGLKFLGEVSTFSTLPRPNPDGSPTPELLAEYDRIAQGY